MCLCIAQAHFYCKICFSKYLPSRDKIWSFPWTCCLLAFYIIVTPGPHAQWLWLEVFASTGGRFLSDLSRISYYLFSYVFLRRSRSFTSRKLYVCLETFLCFLSYLTKLMFLELDVKVYSFIEVSGIPHGRIVCERTWLHTAYEECD